jgi:hypothetical protein
MNRHTQAGICYRALVVLLCLLLSPLPQFAQTSQRAGTISAVRPSAMRNTSLLKAKDQVNWNDLLKTDTGGRMRIGLDDGSILSVGTNSQMRVVRHDAKLQQTQIELSYGKLRSQVARLTRQGSQFEVRTPTAVAGVIGTDFYLEATPNGTRLIVYEGVVTLTPIIAGAVAASQAVQVQSGYSVDVDTNGTISGPNLAPTSLEQQTLSETNVEGVSNAAVAATGGHLLRNVLIGVGLAGAVAGSAIVVKNSTGGGGGKNQQIPPQ